MKKAIILILSLFLCLPSFAIEERDEFRGVGISKYAVLETTFDYTPLREAPDADAKRYTHLKKGIVLFGTAQNSEFFKTDLGLNRPYWVEKRYVEVQGVIPEKRGARVLGINFYEDKKNYYAKIKTPVQTSYKITNLSEGSVKNKTGLEMVLYDAILEDGAKCISKIDNFSYAYKKSAGEGADKNRGQSGGVSEGTGEVTGEGAGEGEIPGILTLNYKGGAVFGYDVIKKDDALIFKVRKPINTGSKKPLKNVKIVLDAGHGGDEKGVVSEGIKEKDVNLQITKKLARELKKQGARVVLTRKKDVNVGLYDRVDFAKERKGDFLISIHQNSLPNPKNFEKKHGSGVYYYNDNARELADCVQKNLIKATGFRDDGVNWASFAITRTTDPVSILIECGYLIHPYERERLTDKKFQKTVAKGIADGMEEYLLNIRQDI